VKGFSAPKNDWKEFVHPEQGPREKDFGYLKAGILPSMAWATEALNAKQANAGFKAAGGETQDIRVAAYSPGAVARGVAARESGAKVADSIDSRPKEFIANSWKDCYLKKEEL